MALRLNHVAVMADSAHDLVAFYREVIGLEPMVAPGAQSMDPNSFKWLRLGGHELHVVQRDDSLAPRLKLSIDPLKAHYAIEVDSVEEIEAVKKRLTDANVRWIDWSPHGIPGKHQVFMVDPGGNLVEFQLAGKKQP